MKVKQLILTTLMASILYAGSTTAVDAAIVPTNPMPNMSQTLDGSYGVGGVDGSTSYFLDQSSYYLNVSGDTAYAGATIYIADRSNPAPGLAANVLQANVSYIYFRNGKDHRVLVKSIITKGGNDITQDTLRKDAGFLYQLFWNIAEKTGQTKKITPRM